jgi:predicted transcriptional regulator
MLTKRGRPEFTDRSTVKSKAMTIVLTDDTLVQLDKIAKQQKHKKATLARLMIEQAIEAEVSSKVI